MNLTTEQIEAAHADTGRDVVIANAGSGKTAVIAERVRWLVADCHVSPRSIVIITFSRAGAAELKSRIAVAIDTDRHQPSAELFVGTIHAFCNAVLQASDAWSHTKILTDTAYRWVREYAKAEYGNRRDARLPTLLKTSDMIDFDTMIRSAPARSPYAATMRHLIVDEAQDTTVDQFLYLSRILAEYPHIRYFAVGDPKQRIYEFAGAAPDMGMASIPSREWPLHTTFRCPVTICRAANAIFPDNPIVPFDPDRVGHVGEIADPQLIIPAGSAILCRYNADVDRMSSFLDQSGIEHHVIRSQKQTHEFLEFISWMLDLIVLGDCGVRGRIADWVGERFIGGLFGLPATEICRMFNSQSRASEYLDVMDESVESERDLKTISALREHVGDVSMISMREIINSPDNVALPSLRPPLAAPHVMTIHQAKGAEFDNVYIKPFDVSGDDDRRLMYVAITRSKNNVFLTSFDGRNQKNDTGVTPPV